MLCPRLHIHWLTNIIFFCLPQHDIPPTIPSNQMITFLMNIRHHFYNWSYRFIKNIKKNRSIQTEFISKFDISSRSFFFFISSRRREKTLSIYDHIFISCWYYCYKLWNPVPGWTSYIYFFALKFWNSWRIWDICVYGYSKYMKLKWSLLLRSFWVLNFFFVYSNFILFFCNSIVSEIQTN